MSRLFPEFGDAPPGPGSDFAAAPAGAPPSAPPPPAGGMSIIGGAWSLRKLDSLLGLPGPFLDKGACGVRRAVALPDGTVELGVEGGGVPSVAFRLRPAAEASAPASAELLMDEDVEPPETVRRLSDQVGARLGRLGGEILLKVLRMDPGRQEIAGARVPTGPAPAQEEAKDRLDSVVQSYASREAWRNFFADKEIQRNFCHNFAGSVVTIGHEDLECHWATPPVGDGTPSFFNYPSIHTRHLPEEQAPRAKGEGQDQRRRSGSENYLISDLNDLDIIKGGAKKLDRLLDSIADDDGGRVEKPDLVIMRSTCVPIVIGDDMEGSVEKFKKKSDIPIVFLDNIADQHATGFREAFTAIKQKPEFLAAAKRPGSVNLVGFPRAAEIRPLLDFINDLGVEINCRVLPDIDVKVMPTYMAADLQVFFDSEIYERTYKTLFGDIPLPSIKPPAPYGIDGTRRWLREIAEATGKQASFEAVWKARFGRLEDEWRSLRSAAADYRLGFVLDAARAKKLADPRLMTGIPVVSVLKEMGFALDFLVYSDVPGGAEAEVGEPASKSAGKNRSFVFKDPAGLEALLKASEAAAFYSEVFFDSRLTRTGKGQFSLSTFEMGLEGAVATARRLLAVCRLPFYRFYGAYLGRAFTQPPRPAGGSR